MKKNNKRGIELSLSPEAIKALGAKAEALGYRSKSALVEAWATGELDNSVMEAISSIHSSLKELSKSVKKNDKN
ncbi:MAG: hypothetical protein ACKPCP_32955 [Sphaerospermopsis kisseleviana]